MCDVDRHLHEDVYSAVAIARPPPNIAIWTKKDKLRRDFDYV